MLKQIQCADLRVHAEVLWQVAQPSAHGVLVAQYIDARLARNRQRGGAAVRFLQRGQGAHQRGLAGAIRAEQPEHAAGNIEGDTGKGVDPIGVRLGQRADLKHADSFPWAMDRLSALFR